MPAFAKASAIETPILGKTNRFFPGTYGNILTCKLFNKIIFL
jgi:hypothetical protein